MAELTDLNQLYLAGNPITNLSALSGLKKLGSLQIDEAQFTSYDERTKLQAALDEKLKRSSSPNSGCNIFAARFDHDRMMEPSPNLIVRWYSRMHGSNVYQAYSMPRAIQPEVESGKV